METTFLTINEAASFIDKSDVTIRRLIKRLLKNRTSETDRCIVEKTEFGKRMYRIEARFLVQHANLNTTARDRLLKQIVQMDTQNETAQGVDKQSDRSPTHTASQTTSSSEQTRKQSDHLDNHVDNVAAQMTGQSESEQSTEQANDQTHGSANNDMPTQTNEIGLGMLKEAMDELRSQLNTKDEQIKEKDNQLAAKDNTIDGLNESIKKMAAGIEQGNFLVASAQQRIPLPEQTKHENMSTQHEKSNAHIVDVEEQQEIDNDAVETAKTTDQEPKQSGGILKTLTNLFSSQSET